MMPEARTPGSSLGCARCPIFRVSQSGVQTEKQWIQGLRSSNQRISIIESAGEPPTGAPFGRARRLSRATEWLSMHGAGVRALVVTSIACVFRGRKRSAEWVNRMRKGKSVGRTKSAGRNRSIQNEMGWRRGGLLPCITAGNALCLSLNRPRQGGSSRSRSRSATGT